MTLIKKLKRFFGLPVEDRGLEPGEYTIETSTFPEIAGESILEGITTALHAGATRVEVTASHPSSFAPHIKRKLKKYMKQEDLKINLHATMQLKTSRAVKKDFGQVQEYLEGYIDVADDLDCDYLNVHTSSFPSPELARITGESRGTTVSPDNDTIEEFIIEMANKSSDVFEHIVDIIEERQNIIRQYARPEIIKEMAEDRLGEDAREKEERIVYEEVRNEYHRRMNEGDEELEERAKEILREWIKDQDDLPFPTGTRAIDELMVYRMIAWKMYEENDPIWRKICGNEDPEKVEEETIDSLIDAVAGKYIEGHIDKLTDRLEETDVKITLETPDARETEYIGYYRLVDIENIHHVVKSIDHPLVKLCIDFEHIASHGRNPKDSVDDAPSDIGEITDVVHLSGAPIPGHKHKPIKKGDIELYELLWVLREKGFKGGYLNFERGGGDEQEGAYQRSLPNLKRIAMLLESGVHPDDLPLEFYGYTDREFKHDQAMVESHTFDPIKGMIESPELKDTFLGGHAIREKRKQPEEWEREEFQ